jgi:tetratricopeptide (TPR) repeat protein
VLEKAYGLYKNLDEIEERPCLYISLMLLSRYNAEKGVFDETKKYLTFLNKFYEFDQEVLFRLAFVNERLGEFDNAEKFYYLLIEKYPEDR